MGLFSKAKIKNQKGNSTFLVTYSETLHKGKYDTGYSFPNIITNKLHPYYSCEPKNSNANLTKCEICKQGSFAYATHNFLIRDFTGEKLDNVLLNRKVKNRPNCIGMYCMNCKISICSECLRYEARHIHFNAQSPNWLVQLTGKENNIYVCTESTLLDKKNTISNIKSLVYIYAIVCPKCDTQYGVFHVPALKNILEPRPANWPEYYPKLEHTYKTAIEGGLFPNFDKVLNKKDENYVERNLDYINNLSFKEVEKAIEELSSIVKILSDKEIFDGTRVILTDALAKFITVVALPRGINEIQTYFDGKNYQDGCKLACRIKNWKQFIASETIFSSNCNEIFDWIDKITAPTIAVSVADIRRELLNSQKK